MSLREVLAKREQKRIPITELVQIAKFVLKNNFCEFNGQIKQQISGIAIGIKRAKFMDKIVEEFLKNQEQKIFLYSLLWWRET